MSINKHVTNNQPSVHPSTRTCSQRKSGKKTILAGDTSYLRKKHDMRNNRQDRNLPCHPPRCGSERTSNKKKKCGPPNRPTDRYPISSFSFYASIIHHSFIIPPNDDNDWPPDSVPSKGTTRSVRSSVTRKRTGRKWTRFSALVCRLHTADCTKMVLFSVWWAGRKAVSGSGSSGSK